MAITRLRVVLTALIVILLGAWLLGLPAGSFSGGFWPIRRTLIYGTGVLALACMSAAVILAARPVQIESVLGGLDKFYRLHRWLGIAALLLSVAHWLLEVGPRWLVGWGWLERAQRRPASPEAAAGFDPFRDLRGIAADLGEWAFYLLVILVVLALWKRFPYHYFFRTHRLMAPVYLVLAFHGFILIDHSYWTAPIGPLLLLLLAGGTVAALVSLFRRIGQQRRAVGVVEAFHHYRDSAAVEVVLRLETAWPGHRAGQFAFVTFDGHEGAHPFTISSAWHGDGRLRFTIKGIGDYTRQLPDRLHVGERAVIEGPYGRFHFHGTTERQIWVAGGVGVTPFIARLEALADQGARLPIDFFYSTSAPSDALIAHVRELAERSGIRFHLFVTTADGLLTFERLSALVPNWRSAEVWFCGPLGFGNALREAMVAQGFPAERFHQELFNLR